MKRIIAILLAVMLIFSLTACNGDAPDTNNDNTNISQNENNGSSQNNSNGNNDNNNKEDNKNENKNELSFTETVALDNNECSIKITDIDPDALFGFTIKVQLENKSTEKIYMYSVESAAINGIQCNTLFANTVAAGKKSNADILFYDSDLENINIGAYTDIELTFRVYDSNDFMADAVAHETVHVYPYGKDKATKFVREAKATDNVIIDNDYVTIIVTGYENNSILSGYSVNLFLINKTDTEVMFSVDNVSVNGYMADPFFATSVIAGKCAFNSISWFKSTFEENNITTVEEIELTFRAYDNNDWFSDDFANEVITLKP